MDQPGSPPDVKRQLGEVSAASPPKKRKLDEKQRAREEKKLKKQEKRDRKAVSAERAKELRKLSKNKDKYNNKSKEDKRSKSGKGAEVGGGAAAAVSQPRPLPKVQAGQAAMRLQGDESAIGPVLAEFGDFAPHSGTQYTLYSKAPGKTASFDDSMLLVGETDTITYVSNNWLSGRAGPSQEPETRLAARDYSGEYLVGVHDPATSTVTLRAAPLFLFKRRIKALSDMTESLSATRDNAAVDWETRQNQRRDLGDAFGNRKTKLKAKAQDRMKVDTGNMGAVMDSMRQQIEDSSRGMADADAVKAEADAQRAIPPPNFDASEPSEAYPVASIVPSAVLHALNIAPLLKAEDQSHLRKLLPGPGPGQSDWLVSRTWDAVQRALYGTKREGAESILKTSGSKDEGKLRLRMCLFMALLWAFRRNSGMLGRDREGLSDKLRLKNTNSGEVIMEDLLARFAERTRGGKKYAVTTYLDTKLLSHIFALSLHLDSFSVDSAALASDLGLAPSKVAEIYKSLGCKSDATTVQQADGTARKEKRMVLRVPFELPRPKRGPAKR